MKEEEQKRSHHKKRLSELREKTDRKIDYHLQKNYIDTADFYHLVTGFFLELLEKDYEPTYEDILNELENIEHDYLLFSEKQRGLAHMLLQQLSSLQYQGKSVSQEQARKILNEFHSLTEEFTEFEEESIERVLHQATKALRAKKKDSARDLYQKLHTMYQKLGAEDKQKYYAEIQSLYAKIQ